METFVPFSEFDQDGKYPHKSSGKLINDPDVSADVLAAANSAAASAATATTQAGIATSAVADITAILGAATDAAEAAALSAAEAAALSAADALISKDAALASAVDADAAAVAAAASAADAAASVLAASGSATAADSSADAAAASAVDAAAAVSSMGAISADTTYTVGSGGAYATFTAALDAMKHKRILPGAYVTLQMVSDVTEPGSLVWSHPDSSRIIISMNSPTRKITLGTPGVAWEAAANGVQGQVQAGFYVPAGDSLVFNSDDGGDTLTLEAPSSLAAGTKAHTVINGRILRSGSTNGLPFISLTSAGATYNYILHASGADFGGDDKSFAYAFRILLDPATSKESSYPVITLSRCSGLFAVYGEGQSASATVRNKIKTESCSMGIATDSMGVTSYYSRLNINVSTTLVCDSGAFWFEGGDYELAGSGGATLKRASIGDSYIALATRGARLSIYNITFDADTKNGTALVSLAGSVPSDLMMNNVTFSNPQASGTFYAVQIINGGTARCTGITYNGTFSSNKSNATSTWSSSTGQFFSN